jgi:hypothetical protein
MMVVVPKFAKGHVKVGGKRKRSHNKATLRERRLQMAVDAADDDITKKVIEEAKSGANWQATAIYYRYLRPRPPKLNSTPLNVEPPRTIEEVRAVCAELAVRVLAGALDTDAAAVAATLLKSVENSIVGFDLAQLLEKLKSEAKQ